MKPRVREILNWYSGDNLGTLTQLARLLNHGYLGGSGKLLLIPMDHGLRQGGQIYSSCPDAYDPGYFLDLASEVGASAVVTPMGSLQSFGRDFIGEVPCLLSVSGGGAAQAQVQSSILLALESGCSGISLEIYFEPKIEYHLDDYLLGVIKEWVIQARSKGLVTVARCHFHPDTFYDQVVSHCYGVIQTGVHILSIQWPIDSKSKGLELSPQGQAFYQKQGIRVISLADKVKHAIQVAGLNARRVVIFEFEEKVDSTFDISENVKQLAQGGAFGCMMSHHFFNQTREKSILNIRAIQNLLIGKVPL